MQGRAGMLPSMQGRGGWGEQPQPVHSRHHRALSSQVPAQLPLLARCQVTSVFREGAGQETQGFTGKEKNREKSP